VVDVLRTVAFRRATKPSDVPRSNTRLSIVGTCL